MDLGIIAAIGAVVLAVVLLYATYRNSQRTPAQERRTEEATRDLYRREDRDAKREGI